MPFTGVMSELDLVPARCILRLILHGLGKVEDPGVAAASLEESVQADIS
jgi:hypothetical protein